MWGSNQGQGDRSPDRFSRSTPTNGSNGESASDGQAAALAARMAFANAYDTASPGAPPPAPSSFFDVYGSNGGPGQPASHRARPPPPPPLGEPEDRTPAAILYAQRARELELFHLQQQMQERQAIENEARNRLLEHAARNQIQEYERTRMQLELMAEMQQRDHESRMGAERSRLVQAEGHASANHGILSQHDMDAAAAQNLQEQQMGDYNIAKQHNQSLSSPLSLAANDATQQHQPLSSPQSSTLDEEEETSSPLEQKIPSSPTSRPEYAVDGNENDVIQPAPMKEPLPDAPSSHDPPHRAWRGMRSESPNTAELAERAKKSPKEDAPRKEAPKKDSPKKVKNPKKDSKKRKGQDRPATKKEASPKKQTPSKTGKEKIHNEKNSPRKDVGSVTSPFETPSSSPLVSNKKTSLAEFASATSKKRKKTPSRKTSDASSNKSKRSKKSPGTAKPAAAPAYTSLVKRKTGAPSMDDAVPAITDVQFESAEALMAEFCKVPFLAEFSRPVSLLHPEMVTLYSKTIPHPMDLGHVCRAIRRRQYENTRAIQLDVWRVFSNCIKFHMHPNTKDIAIPSFISIAVHLRDFFNSLWQEYMMPSDAPPRSPGKISHLHSTYQKRAEARKERLLQVSATIMTPKCQKKLVAALASFISSGGKVDKQDRDAILGNANNAKGDIATFIESLRDLIKTIEKNIDTGQEYTVLALHRDLKKCYTEDHVFAHEILKKMKISQRLDRILGKTLAPIQEASCRGVNQSSIWACMAAAIWARESKKKPYWPGIVLGILAPDDQKEDWHQAVTDRNEGRLPEKLRIDLKVAKRRAELALKRQNSDLMSYFLVEFMGSHEFIWVKESDILENFDPEEDVNIASAAGNITKRKRSTAFNTKQMTNAIEEGRWALEEFEMQLSNSCGDRSDDEEEFNEASFTFDTLCQSDDEADDMIEDDHKGHESDLDELNELLGSDGHLDFSVEGRKRAKARVLSLKKVKKEKIVKEKEKSKKSKTPSKNDTKKVEKQLGFEDKREDKRETRELEVRRKRRARDHDKMLKELERKAKKKQCHSEKRGNPHEVQNKRGRAEAIAKGFLLRKCIKDSSFHGASFQPIAAVEPTGLLGMALAFRAVAGEIPFLDNAGKPFLGNSWDNIDADSPSDSHERCKRLQEQIDLIEKEIVIVDAATERRLALAEDAGKTRLAAQNKILVADEQVRATYAKKKKKAKKQLDMDKEPSKGDHDATSVDRSDDKPDCDNEPKETSNVDQDEE